MEWPSKNVHPGGILHPAKVNYSPETHQFLKLLMEESKMSMAQRQKLNYFLRNGEPFPVLRSSSSNKSSRIPKVTIRPGSSKRRSKDTIVQSGVYERERFRPMHPRVDREREKEKLQNIMAFNKDIHVAEEKLMKRALKKLEEEDLEVNRFDQLMQEIKEREEWLREMEALGEADKYRAIIQQQIHAKIREMDKLKDP